MHTCVSVYTISNKQRRDVVTVPEEFIKVSVKVVRIIRVLSNGKTAVTLIYDVTFHTRYRAATPPLAFLQRVCAIYANFIILFLNAIHADVASYCLTAVHTRIRTISTLVDL